MCGITPLIDYLKSLPLQQFRLVNSRGVTIGIRAKPGIKPDLLGPRGLRKFICYLVRILGFMGER